MLKLTKQLWKTILDVQREGNKIIWQDDFVTWKKADFWEFPKEIGKKKYEDCDGITLWKMDALLKKGVDKDYLTMVVCYTEEKEGHAILCVTTDEGDYFLDNRFGSVVSYKELITKGYKLLYRSKIGGKLSDPWIIIT